MQEQLRNVLSVLRAGRLPFRRQPITPEQRKLVSIILTIAITVSAALVAAVPMTTSAAETNVLANGSFEQGFVNVPGCGIVGAGWNCFTNGGGANYGFYDDQWEPVVADGKHSQLIEINGKGLMAPDHDRYAGLSQTVRVSPWGKYTFTMRAMVRTTNHEGDPWRYRVEVGWVKGPNADWRHVDNWTDAGINTYFDRLEPGYFTEFRTTLAPEAEVITLFVRVWRKWGVPNEELDVNLDGIALIGPPAGGIGGKESPRALFDWTQPQPEPQPAVAAPKLPLEEPQWSPSAGKPEVCGGPNMVYNGDFEDGFNRTALGDIGRGWGGFINGGAANYGFYDEQWEAVVSMASRQTVSKPCCGDVAGNGQLIEINSKGVYPTDADRYAGIFQRIGGLTPGGVYQLTVRGLLRGEGNEEDPYRFEAQWGINPGADTEWRNVSHWEGMDLGPIYDRTEPGPLGTYTVKFKAPASSVVLFIRGWKKWAVTNVEMDFNLDDISLVSCSGSGGGWGGNEPQPWPQPQLLPQPQPQPQPQPVDECTHVVRPGDTLGGIARQYGISIDALVNANRISNQNVIYVGQTLVIPGCSGGGAGAYVQPAPIGPQSMGPQSMGPQSMAAEAPISPLGMANSPEPMREGGPLPMMAEQALTHVVRPGDSLGMIAQQYGVDPYALVMANGIDNANVIYVGQSLRIP